MKKKVTLFSLRSLVKGERKSERITATKPPDRHKRGERGGKKGGTENFLAGREKGNRKEKGRVNSLPINKKSRRQIRMQGLSSSE